MKLLLTFHKQFKVKNSKYWLNLSNKLQQNKNKYRKKNEIFYVITANSFE